jgi:tetraacyldisaccharide-1-P 4'-kinase
LGLEVTYRWVFGDHHSYHPTELQRVAEQARRAGADVLVTTEKDSVNLPQTAAEIVRPFPLFWLRIGIEIEREEELLKLLS